MCISRSGNGRNLLLEDPCNTETSHQEKPANVDEVGEIQDVELSSQEWIDSNLFADQVLGTEPCHDSKARVSIRFLLFISIMWIQDIQC